MKMNIIFVGMLSVLGLNGVQADELIVNAPKANDIIGNEIIGVSVSIKRSGIVYIRNMTTIVFDKNGTEITNVFKETLKNVDVTFDIKTDVKPGQVVEYDVKFIGYGRTVSVMSDETGNIKEMIDFVNSEVVVPIKIDLSKVKDVQNQMPPNKSSSAKLFRSLLMIYIISFVTFMI